MKTKILSTLVGLVVLLSVLVLTIALWPTSTLAIVPRREGNPQSLVVRTLAHVLRVNLSADRLTATGVTYRDAQGREVEQPADIVVIAAFQFHNVRLMLLSGIGTPYDPATGNGTIGRNFAYQNMATIKAFFDRDVHANPFIGSGGNGVAIDDFNADNFDHGPAGFVGGSPMWLNQGDVKPISGITLPDGTPGWGSKWKEAVADNYTHTCPWTRMART